MTATVPVNATMTTPSTPSTDRSPSGLFLSTYILTASLDCCVGLHARQDVLVHRHGEYGEAPERLSGWNSSGATLRERVVQELSEGIEGPAWAPLA